MSPHEQQQLKALFVSVGLYYGQQFPDEVLKLFVADLVDLQFTRVVGAMQELRRDPKTTRCPLPAVIRARVNPESDPEAEAVEAVSRIVQAISSIGPYRTEDARAFVGELGWLVVTREGGWLNVCQFLNDDNMGTLKAQWRQLAIAQHKRARAGASGAPELPTLGGKSIGINIGQLLPEMPKCSGVES